ncbi:MAG: CDP-diacylglycerol--serine O-phosphatidyltransferase [Chitinophagales bacterium]|nr:CDP-diacylglycerol--serine O-phosphatidyltransferase [Chitinophagales bacterium]
MKTSWTQRILMQIPNLITLGNLFCGVYAIVLLFGEKIHWACMLVFIAALLDFLDGFAAKLLNAKSPMGGQLDSLADVVTFGVVPGIIMYQLLAYAYQLKDNAIGSNNAWFAIAFILPLASAWRLARYNITEAPADGRFFGLPTPMMGLTVACLPMTLFMNNPIINDWILRPWILHSIILVLAWLMISKVPMMNLKPAKWTIAGNELRLLLIVLAVAAAIFLQYAAGPIILVLYIGLSALQNKPVLENNNTN